jgi:hypothetical protein
MRVSGHYQGVEFAHDQDVRAGSPRFQARLHAGNGDSLSRLQAHCAEAIRHNPRRLHLAEAGLRVAEYLPGNPGELFTTLIDFLTYETLGVGDAWHNVPLLIAVARSSGSLAGASAIIPAP